MNCLDEPRDAEITPELTRRDFDDARSRAQFLELQFSHVADAIFVTEMDGRIVEANPAAWSGPKVPDGNLHAVGSPGTIHSATMKRKASAVWQGGLKDGRGTISTESGVLSDTGYSFARRFEGEPGTNPEELIAAAHASCFSMALSAQLGEAGLTPQRIETAATVTLEKLPDGFAVTASHLDVNVTIPGADEGKFNEAAKRAKEGCPISKLLNAKITMDARLNPAS